MLIFVTALSEKIMFPFQNYKIYRTSSEDSPIINQTKYAIWLSDAQDQEDNPLLLKILEAIDWKVEDIDFIDQLPAAEDEYLFILTFGSEEEPKYSALKNKNTTTIHSDSLQALDGSVDLKKRLWQELKNLG